MKLKFNVISKNDCESIYQLEINKGCNIEDLLKIIDEDQKEMNIRTFICFKNVDGTDITWSTVNRGGSVEINDPDHVVRDKLYKIPAKYCICIEGRDVIGNVEYITRVYVINSGIIESSTKNI